MNLKELSKKEVKEILEKLSDYYGIDISFLREISKKFCWLSNKEGKIYITNKSVKKYIKNFLPHRVGLYIAKKEKNYIRLSIEGSQLLGVKATKNILNLNSDIVLSTEIVDNQELDRGYYILRSQNDYLGCGFSKNNKLKIMISKNRRISK